MKNFISIIAAFILITAVISCGGNKETNQSEQNTQTNQKSQNNNTQNIQTNTSQTNNQKEFFDMKYVYKGVRADKTKFDEKLKKLRENNMQKGILIFLIGNLQMMMKEKNIL